MKGQPIQREREQKLVGFQIEHWIMQECPAINSLLMVSVYSQHIAIPHNGCIYGWMVQVHITVPRQVTGNLMGILEERLSLCFTDYCAPPEDGYGIYVVTKNIKREQECQLIYYDFYLTPGPAFQPLLDFQ